MSNHGKLWIILYLPLVLLLGIGVLAVALLYAGPHFMTWLGRALTESGPGKEPPTTMFERFRHEQNEIAGGANHGPISCILTPWPDKEEDHPDLRLGLANTSAEPVTMWYPADLGHNFVLAPNQRNNAKSDYLAAEKHLAAWAERNQLHKEELQSRLQEAALPCDLSSSIQIAKWVYQQTEKANGQVWVMEKVLQHLSPAWSQCLSA